MPQTVLKVSSMIAQVTFTGTWSNLQTDDDGTSTVQTLSAADGYIRCHLDDVPSDAVAILQMQAEAKCSQQADGATIQQGFYYSPTFDYETYVDMTGSSYVVKQNAWDPLNPIGGGWTVAIANATAIQLYKTDSDGNAWYTYLWANCDWSEGGSTFFWQWWAPILFGLESLGHCLKMENADKLMNHLQRVIRSTGCLHIPIACDYRRLMEQLPQVTR